MAAQGVSYWTRGMDANGPLFLYRVTTDATTMRTESFDPGSRTWKDDPGDFMWSPDARTITPEQAHKAMAVMCGRLPALREAADTSPDETGVVTTSQIIARGDTLDIPYESPDPAGPIQYGGEAPAEPVDDPEGREYRLAWANHFNYGTPAPPEKEEGDGNGDVSEVPGGSGPGAGGGAAARVPAAEGRSGAGGPNAQQPSEQPVPQPPRQSG